MEELKTQLLAVAGAAATAVLAYLVAVVRNRIANSKAKAQKPLVEMLTNALNNEYLLPILRNVYQTFTKKKKSGDDSWTEAAQAQALDEAYSSLLKSLPEYLITAAKKVFPNYEAALKEKIQQFYENNKNIINIEIGDVL